MIFGFSMGYEIVKNLKYYFPFALPSKTIFDGQNKGSEDKETLLNGGLVAYSWMYMGYTGNLEEVHPSL